MRVVTYTDADGFVRAVWLPDYAPDREAPRGIPIGPQSLDGLDLPLEIKRSINNEFAARSIWGPAEIRRRRQDASIALMRAYRVGVEDIEAAWLAQ